MVTSRKGNNMITEDYCNSKISELLREKGFEEPCHAYWHKDENKLIISHSMYAIRNTTDPHFYIGPAAPTLQMVMKWLREVHGIIPIILTGDSTQNPLYYWFRIDKFIDGKLNYAIYREAELEFTTYEEACEAAIEYCLKNLVK